MDVITSILFISIRIDSSIIWRVTSMQSLLSDQKKKVNSSLKVQGCIRCSSKIGYMCKYDM